MNDVDIKSISEGIREIIHIFLLIHVCNKSFKQDVLLISLTP